MHKFLLGGIFSLLMFISKAQYPGFAVVKDSTSFRMRFASANKKINSIKCDFIQDKNLSMLTEKITSKGVFMYKKVNRLRMEYTYPYEYLMIINNDKFYVKDDKKETKISSKSNKSFQQINKIMIDCIQGTALENSSLISKIFENKSTYLIEVTPLEHAVKEMFKKIIIYLDKKDYSISMLEMNELSGDNTVIKFNNKELNATVSDALFYIK